MRVVTTSDVLNWKPDMSDLGHVSDFTSVTEKVRRYDLSVFTTPVYIVRILNEMGEDVWSARIAGNDGEVAKAADELLCRMCRRFPGSFLKSSMQLFIPRD